MSNEEKRQGMTLEQVQAIMHSNNPEQVEALIFTVYMPYLEVLRGWLDRFPQPARRDLELLIADFNAGRILRHFEFRPGEALPISAGAKLLVKILRDFDNDMKNEKQ